MLYNVTLESKDGHLFETTVGANTEYEAVNLAKEIIQEKEWDVYQYEGKSVEKVTDTKSE